MSKSHPLYVLSDEIKEKMQLQFSYKSKIREISKILDTCNLLKINML
jgi:hypothetical protein